MDEHDVERASAAELLQGWRQAERAVEPLTPGSAAWHMARHNADRARDMFHEREGEAHAEHGLGDRVGQAGMALTDLSERDLLQEPTG